MDKSFGQRFDFDVNARADVFPGSLALEQFGALAAKGVAGAVDGLHHVLAFDRGFQRLQRFARARRFLGGGIHFAAENYPLDAFAERLKAFAAKFGVQIYLEPGEAAITLSTSLETTVLDTLYNGKQLAIVDASIEAHMLDLLIYRSEAKLLPDAFQGKGNYPYMVCGKSCLAGDIFGEYRFEQPLQIGDRISFCDAAGYTMVKKNWFNGVNMPSIAVRELDGSIRLIKEFNYRDYVESLS